MDSKDTKLTIRISEGDLEEIDEFLNRNPRFGSRSEFIRHSAMEYIAQSRVGIIGSQETSVKLDKLMEETLYMAIEKGFFKSINDAIFEIIELARSNGLVSKLIRDKISEYTDLREEISNFEGDEHELPIEKRKHSNDKSQNSVDQ